MTKQTQWIPEIVYEDTEDTNFTKSLPMIQVPLTEEMPTFLLIWKSQLTGETEPGPDGEKLPITEMDLVQYANMSTLKENLSVEMYDEVRKALGLEPLAVATAAGLEISSKVKETMNQVEETLNSRVKVDDSN